jgi:alpha-beta hydrolase superfamily lysophospholipase
MPGMKLSFRPGRRSLVAALASVLLAAAGCSALDEQQRRWIFQPSKASWNGGWAAQGLDDVWLQFTSELTGRPVKLHGLWLPQTRADAPVMLYLHGARWNLASSASRMRRMHELGFSVLGIDYRGFGQSTDELPSEDSAHEDALAGWRWLAEQRPGAARHLYGHSLGGAIAVRLAHAVESGPERAAGLIVEGSFTSIPDLVSTFRYGWLPVGPLISQRFDSASRVGELKTPLIVVHGESDRLVPHTLGRELYERAAGPKRFVLVEGGTHHNAGARGLDDIRQALGLFTNAAGSAAGTAAGAAAYIGLKRQP